MDQPNPAPEQRPSILPLIALGVVFIGSILWGILSPATPPDPAKSQTQSDEANFIKAIDAFHLAYGYYPCATTPGDDTADFSTPGGQSQAELINTLRGEKNPAGPGYNWRHTPYLNLPPAKDPAHPKSGTDSNGVWYDPWGRPYLIKIDSNYNGQIFSPFSTDGDPHKIPVAVIIWSLGSDGKSPIASTNNDNSN